MVPREDQPLLPRAARSSGRDAAASHHLLVPSRTPTAGETRSPAPRNRWRRQVVYDQPQNRVVVVPTARIGLEVLLLLLLSSDHSPRLLPPSLVYPETRASCSHH